MSKYSPAHMVRERTATWSRKRKAVAGIAGATLAAVAGFALALVLVRGIFTGGGNVDPTEAANLTITDAAVISETGVDCQVSAAGGIADIQLVDGIAGGTCDVRFGAHHPQADTYTLVFQNVQFSDAYVTSRYVNGSVGGAWEGRCGGPVATSNGGANTTDDVVIRFTIKPELVLGVPSFTADSDAGLYAVDQASYVAANCPAA